MAVEGGMLKQTCLAYRVRMVVFSFSFEGNDKLIDRYIL